MARLKSPKFAERRINRALVVEDDAILASAIAAALEDCGAQDVQICHSIASTMAELERARPDAIILDVHLTDRDDGWALAELVDQLGPPRPRIAFSTGSPSDIPPEIAGMGMVFEKPFDPAQLARALAHGTAPRGLLTRLRGVIKRPA